MSFMLSVEIMSIITVFMQSAITPNVVGLNVVAPLLLPLNGKVNLNLIKFFLPKFFKMWKFLKFEKRNVMKIILQNFTEKSGNFRKNFLNRKFWFPLFVQLGFNLSNGVTDTLESITILIYLQTRKSIYTQKEVLIKWKSWLNEITDESIMVN